jgi:transcriptional regulator with XRE-family HTH domain
MARYKVNGAALKELREDQGISTTGLANRIGVGQSTIKGLESGRTASAAPVVIKALSQHLGCRPTDLAPDYLKDSEMHLGSTRYDRGTLANLFSESGMTLQEWADLAGFSVGTAHSLLNRRMNGRKGYTARFSTLYGAAEALGVNVTVICPDLFSPEVRSEEYMGASF